MSGQPEVQGDRVYALRTQRNLTQLDLSELTGIPAPEISRIENGRNPRVAGWKVALLAGALETTMDYLFGLTDRPGRAGHLNQNGADEALEALRSLSPRQRRKLLEFVREVGEDSGDGN
jgi:transcriptional regulator with XRE-family HTH domain